MKKQLQLSCNLRFNPNNPYHVKAARALSIISPRYKTTFVALAIEAYMAAHPMGVDMAELLEAGKAAKRSYKPKSSIVDNRGDPENSVKQTDRVQVDRQVIDSAMDYYDIE